MPIVWTPWRQLKTVVARLHAALSCAVCREGGELFLDVTVETILARNHRVKLKTEDITMTEMYADLEGNSTRDSEGSECSSLLSLHCERTMKVISGLGRDWLIWPPSVGIAPEPASHQRDSRTKHRCSSHITSHSTSVVSSSSTDSSSLFYWYCVLQVTTES